MIGAAETPQTFHSVPLPVFVALIGLAGSIAVASLTAAAARFSAAAERRREGYALAVRNLVRWKEYPYRIRRRAGDGPDVLSALASEGHTIQEDLRCSETWVAADKGWAGELYREVRIAMAGTVGTACADAWNSPPVTAAAQMNLNGFGPSEADEQIRRFEKAVHLRFGLWRLITWIRPLRSWILSRPKRTEAQPRA